MAESPAITADPHVLLIGHPPIRELLGFVRSQAIDGQTADRAALVAEWRTANDHLRTLEQQEAGWADNPTIEPLPEALAAHAKAVSSTPAFRKAFGYFPTQIAMVNLDQLVVCQRHINLAFADQVRERIGPSPTELEVMALNIPLLQQAPPARVMQVAPNTYTFVSASSDLRFIEPILFDPAQIPGRDDSGPAVGAVGLIVGYGPNHLHVLNIEGRLILNNGSHRAYALRELGINRVPCVLQTLTRRDELELVNEILQKSPDRYLTSARPPLFKDYFDLKLRKVIAVPRKNHTVKVWFGVDKGAIPAV